MKRVALAVALLIALATPSQADLRAGLAAYARGDYATALQGFEALAEQGDASGQFFLGTMYGDGRGVPRDDAKAAKWYRKAAEQGLAGAQYRLGVMYRKGRGVALDQVEAAKWYRKAAEQGLADAQYRLGVMYNNGLGVPQDFALAHMWFNLAASRFALGSDRDVAIKGREGVARLMTPAQIAEAQRLAREWKPK